MATMESMTTKTITQLRGGLLGAVQLVLDHEVVELVQGVFSLIGLLAQVLQQALQARVAAHIRVLRCVQQPLHVLELGFDLLGVEAELRAGHVGCSQEGGGSRG
uniref:Uncharacterized protein n=1 Tax=Aegilops tauschii TaxID=37682 RepID=M8CH15_AEGTA